MKKPLSDFILIYNNCFKLWERKFPNLIKDRTNFLNRNKTLYNRISQDIFMFTFDVNSILIATSIVSINSKFLKRDSKRGYKIDPMFVRSSACPSCYTDNVRPSIFSIYRPQVPVSVVSQSSVSVCVLYTCPSCLFCSSNIYRAGCRRFLDKAAMADESWKRLTDLSLNQKLHKEEPGDVKTVKILIESQNNIGIHRPSDLLLRSESSVLRAEPLWGAWLADSFTLLFLIILSYEIFSNIMAEPNIPKHLSRRGFGGCPSQYRYLIRPCKLLPSRIWTLNYVP